MIHPYDNSTQTRWDRGELKVQLNQLNNPRPIGFCDGTPEDFTELCSIAENEGVDDMIIDKKTLKTGREIWTLSGGEHPGEQSDDE
ncbi:hypothetical protein KAR48_20400 [bacterium]|nr:hypothetical protein [bacterium]